MVTLQPIFAEFAPRCLARKSDPSALMKVAEFASRARDSNWKECSDGCLKVVRSAR